MDFITLDFETADRATTSPCELGLTFVTNGRVGETKSWLIRPEPNTFDYFNILMHGIRPETVENEPVFEVVWEEAKPLLEGQFVIAHNAGFDIGVLRRSLQRRAMPLPSFDYACSRIFSKPVWPGQPSYGLKELCVLNEINFKHHRAGPDSRATAELAMRAFQLAGVEGPGDFPGKLRTIVGKLFPDGYKPCKTKSEREGYWRQPSISTLVADPAKENQESIFHGRNVVFTGALSSMTRTEAQQTILDIGGFPQANVTKSTDYLVVGQQDYRLVGETGMSSKQKKAMKMKVDGEGIEIISESDFLQNL